MADQYSTSITIWGLPAIMVEEEKYRSPTGVACTELRFRSVEADEFLPDVEFPTNEQLERAEMLDSLSTALKYLAECCDEHERVDLAEVDGEVSVTLTEYAASNGMEADEFQQVMAACQELEIPYFTATDGGYEPGYWESSCVRNGDREVRQGAWSENDGVMLTVTDWHRYLDEEQARGTGSDIVRAIDDHFRHGTDPRTWEER